MKILLTGASTGIGAAILDLLVANRDNVVYVLGNNQPKSHIKTYFYKVNLKNNNSLFNVIDQIISDSGGIDVIINNAGEGLFSSIETINYEDWENLFKLNVHAPFYIVSRLIESMKKNKFGHIVNISSDADENVFKNATAYCATKHALLGMSNALRLELIGTGVKVTVISPSRVDTNFNSKKVGDRPNSLSAKDVAEVTLAALYSSKYCVYEHIKLKSSME